MSKGDKLLFIRPFVTVLVLAIVPLANFGKSGLLGFLIILCFCAICLAISYPMSQKMKSPDECLMPEDNLGLNKTERRKVLNYCLDCLFSGIKRNLVFISLFCLLIVLFYFFLSDNALYLMVISFCLFLVADCYFSAGFNEKRFPLSTIPVFISGQLAGRCIHPMVRYFSDTFLVVSNLVVAAIPWVIINMHIIAGFQFTNSKFCVWLLLYFLTVLFSGYVVIGPSISSRYLVSLANRPENDG